VRKRASLASVLAAAAAAVGAFVTSAQASDPVLGVPSWGTFEETNHDAVNRQNLNVVVDIPIIASPDRGNPLKLDIVYNSLLWRVQGGAWTPVTNANGLPTWGWTTDREAKVISWSTDRQRCGNGYATRFWNYSYVDPSGTVHYFDVDFYQVLASADCDLPTDLPRKGNAADYSGYALDATSANGPRVLVPGGGTITNRNGMSGTVPDANGNYYGFSVTTLNGVVTTSWTDTVGRQALQIAKAADHIDYTALAPSGNVALKTTLSFSTYNVRTAFGCSGVSEFRSVSTSLRHLPAAFSDSARLPAAAG